MIEKVEFRVDGYTIVSTVELDFDPETESGTAYIPYLWGGELVRGCTELMLTFTSFWQLSDVLRALLGIRRIEHYMEFMRGDLSHVWFYRVPL